MSIIVSVADVQQRVGIPNTELNSEIAAMISQLVGPIEYAIRPELLTGTPSGLQQTFNLAALEIVAGETAAYMHLLPGYFEEVSAGTFQIKRVPADPPEDPSGLKAQGWDRLRPYLRNGLGKAPAADVRSASGKRDRGTA